MDDAYLDRTEKDASPYSFKLELAEGTFEMYGHISSDGQSTSQEVPSEEERNLCTDTQSIGSQESEDSDMCEDDRMLLESLPPQFKAFARYMRRAIREAGSSQHE